MKLHSNHGENYQLKILNDQEFLDSNKREFSSEFFKNLQPAIQADIVRVFNITNHGGIWLDSDTLVMSNLDILFKIIEKYDGFFITEEGRKGPKICNGVFGSKPNTPLMKEWKKFISLQIKANTDLEWGEIGWRYLTECFKQKPQLFTNYLIFDGSKSMYPIFWDSCKEAFIKKDYEFYKNIQRDFQPLIILVNSVYKEVANKSIKSILNQDYPINYFLKKSLDNLLIENTDTINTTISIDNNINLIQRDVLSNSSKNYSQQNISLKVKESRGNKRNFWRMLF